MNHNHKLEKILFRFYSNLFEEETAETMKAYVVDKKKGLYQLENIPFYAPLLAPEDVIFAEYDEKEGMLTYRKTVEYSGNTVVQVVITDEGTDTNEIRKQFMKMGCKSEKSIEGYFSMEIPLDLDYGPVRKKLDELEHKKVIAYGEPCLSEKHKQEIA